ncbi:hypothetical protein M1563_01055 [Patescibacteria group bacterium]|nr:hypothetical protein [Patescibacteria group bacterium]MCL5410175.1 hypothetical protein [Patescibacteria group bacterium]
MHKEDTTAMLVDTTSSSTTLLALSSFWWVVKVALLILSGLYFIFSLIVVRQVSLMTETLITEVSPFLRAFSILHAGVALGIVILLFGLLFQ